MLVAAGLGTLRAWPPFAVVMSGSMAPTINTGDMVVLQRLREPARIGEIVAVPVPDDARARYGYPPVVIHRVVRIIGDQIRTKGDARPTVDPFTVPRTAVDARVIAHIPAGGRVLAFFHSAPGLLWLLCGGVLFFGLPLLERARDARRQETAVSHDLVASVAGELARLQAEQERSRESAVEAVAQLDRLTQFIERAIADRPDVVPVATSSDVAADRMEPVRDAVSSPVEPVPEGSGPSSPAPRAHITARCTAPARPAVGSAVIAAAIQTRPEQRRSVPPAERWDAPPRSASTDSTGWAAPPSPMHSGRFHRSGRLVAASLVHAAAEA